MATLVRIVYVSVIAPDLATGDLERLVANARRRNRQLDLTGALLVCDGHFLQVLEGRAAAVDEMAAKIAADSRHHDLRVLERTTVKLRLFADWALASVDESRCDVYLQALLQGRATPSQFLADLRDWIEEEREAPF